ncbi:hypothetical protein ACFSJY_12405 [Thalassotalea euphylliae]|uniref:hypothetical protein n=1 Tax=Thalassotalea euphylliae TaxID=1655234 RepID=UPI00362F632A
MLKRIFSFLWAVFLLFLFVVSDDIRNPSTPDNPTFSSISQLISEQQFDKALAEIEFQLKQLPPMGDATEDKVWLLNQKAEVHARSYHFHYAIQALEQANTLKPNNRNVERMQRWQQQIERQQSERTLYQSYRPGLDNGMSRTLRNKVHIVYVYIDDGYNKKWTGKRRLANKVSIDQVTQWYQREAQKYGIAPPEFNVRYFLIHSPRGIEKHMLRTRATFGELTNLLLKHTQHSDISSFTRSIRGRGNNDSVALVFHSNYQDRSYASRCHSADVAVGCHYEYAMLTEDVSRKKFAWVIPQVQAHEILHLFGAADLYNISDAKDYAVTDVMNYFSSNLTYSTIEPITAWAIGWQPKPVTPFSVE